MKYEILQSTSATDLAEQVQKKLDTGWRPVGGVSTYAEKQRDRYDQPWDQYWFVQAVTFTPRELEAF